MSEQSGRIARARARIRTVPGLKRDVVVLISLVVLGLIVGGYILSRQQMHWPWENKFTFSATFENAPAISPGNGQEVRIAGVIVGDIRSASVDDDGHARIEMAIDPQHNVYDNARTVLRPKSALNEMYIELSPGGPPGKPLGENGILPMRNSQRPIQVDEVLGHLDSNTRKALTTLLAESDIALASAPKHLPAGVSAADKVLRDLQPVVGSLQTRQDTLKKLVTSLGQISRAVGANDSRLSSLADSLQRTLSSVGKRNTELDSALAQLPEFTSQLKRATGTVLSLSDQLDPTLDNLRKASRTLPGSLSTFDKTVDEVGNTVDVAKPLIEKAVPVVHDLRPVITDVNGALPDLKVTSKRLPGVTSSLLPYLDDLQAFVYNTTSTTSIRDANSGLVRALAVLSPSTVDGLLPLLPGLQSENSN